MKNELTSVQLPFKVIVRGLTGCVSVVLGSFLGYWVAILAFSFVSSNIDNKDIGVIWGSRVAAVTALWKATTDLIHSFRDTWKYVRGQNGQFDHIKAILGIATIAFGLVLGYMTFVPGFHESRPPPPASEPQIVYMVTHQGPEAPVFLVSPMLVFKSAGLRNRSAEHYSSTTKGITPELFLEGSVTLSEKQVQSASRLVSRLIKDCIYDGSQKRLVIDVYGFANDLPIRNENGTRRADSDVLNLAAANFRGEEVWRILSGLIKENSPNLIEEVVLNWEPWKSLGEMQTKRDKEIFRNVQIALSENIDHRSSVLVISEPGTCPQFSARKAESEG